jgi:hypothetical protein
MVYIIEINRNYMIGTYESIVIYTINSIYKLYIYYIWEYNLPMMGMGFVLDQSPFAILTVDNVDRGKKDKGRLMRISACNQWEIFRIQFMEVRYKVVPPR